MTHCMCQVSCTPRMAGSPVAAVSANHPVLHLSGALKTALPRNHLWLLLAAPASVAAQQAAEGADEGEHAMLRVLVSQRDRFRARAQQLEEQAAQVGLTRRQMAVSSALWVWAQQAEEQA